MDWKDALSQLQTEMVPENEPTPPSTESSSSDPVAQGIAAHRGRLIIEMERKGRGGKTATIISGFTLDDDTVSEIAARLKKTLGTGGSARGGEILIQGDRRDAIREILRCMGFKTN